MSIKSDKRPQQPISMLQQRMIVFSTATQDLLAAAMQLQQENANFRKELPELRQKIVKLQIQLKTSMQPAKPITKSVQAKRRAKVTPSQDSK